MPLGIGVWEILVVLLVALLVFGPRRLPEMGGSLGRGLWEFKGAITGLKSDVEIGDAAPELPAAAEARGTKRLNRSSRAREQPVSPQTAYAWEAQMSRADVGSILVAAGEHPIDRRDEP